MALLDRVKYPRDIRELSRPQLRELAKEARERHIDVVSKVGGHFGASLGVAELTVALHYVFDTPKDKIVWDTGHQAYIHKILTGRNDRFPTIRQKDGLAPFCRRDESEYDAFGAGHAATSISAAWGMAVARDLNGDDFSVLAVIGDGAMGCGLAYEALNNAGHTGRDFIVILNDNEMSIAPNVGAMNKYLTTMITNPTYNRVRREVRDLLRRVPTSLGEVMEHLAYKLDESVKNFFMPGMLFQELGFRYVGPVEGHNLDAVVDTLTGVKHMKGPILVHVLTQKGKGFCSGRGGSLQVACGQALRQGLGERHGQRAAGLPRYQKVFGKGLVELGEQNDRVVAITAGMRDGTSTDLFGEAFPTRFFDVGIAEGHAVTFAAGLATEGIRPVVAIYSTFLQRGFDGIVHDVALQGLPVVFAMDRAGCGRGGRPHPPRHVRHQLYAGGARDDRHRPQGRCGDAGSSAAGSEPDRGPFSIRWPRDSVPEPVPHLSEIPEVAYGTWEILREGKGTAVLAVGTMVLRGMKAAEALAKEGSRLRW